MEITPFITGIALGISLFCFWKTVFSEPQPQKCTCLDSLKKYPYAEILNTRLEEFLKTIIQMEQLKTLGDCYDEIHSLAEALGYELEHQPKKDIWKKKVK